MKSRNSQKPSGSQLEQLQRRKTKVLSTVFVIVAAHVLPITGLLLMQGCKPDAQSMASNAATSGMSGPQDASSSASSQDPQGEIYNEFVEKEKEKGVTMPIASNPSGITAPIAPDPSKAIQPAEAPDLQSAPPSQWAIKPAEKKTVPAEDQANEEGASPSDSSSGSLSSVERKLVEHVVRSGEVLGRIAPTYQTTVKAILETNPGLDPRRLQLGQKLVIPQGSSPTVQASSAPAVVGDAPKASGKTHVVQAGDSLSAIARTYGVSLSALREANGIRSHIIHPGQVFSIPVKNVASGK